MEPAVGAYMPAMQLKIVLLPEPFGPIRPRIWPSFTSNETFDTAVKPSNILVRPETVRSATRGSLAGCGWGQTPRDAVGQKPWRRGEGLTPACTRRGPTRIASARVGVARGQRQHRIDGLDRGRPGDLGGALDILHYHWGGALVLARHTVPRREELNSVALDGAALGDVGLERGLAQGLRIEASVLLDGARQHVGEEDPGLVEAHRHVRRHLLGAGCRLVALDHLGGEVAETGLQA